MFQFRKVQLILSTKMRNSKLTEFQFRKVQLIQNYAEIDVSIFTEFQFRKVQLIPLQTSILTTIVMFQFRKVQLIRGGTVYRSISDPSFNSARSN